jgi:hypothetical protein
VVSTAPPSVLVLLASLEVVEEELDASVVPPVVKSLVVVEPSVVELPVVASSVVVESSVVVGESEPVVEVVSGLLEESELTVELEEVSELVSVSPSRGREDRIAERSCMSALRCRILSTN